MDNQRCWFSRTASADLHNRLQKLLEVNNVLRHLDNMLLNLLSKDEALQTERREKVANLLVHIFPQIETSFISDLDAANVQGIYNSLDRLGSASGSRSEREYSKMWVLRH